MVNARTVKRAKDWAEIAKNIAEVVALVIAGLWAWRMFGLTQAPLLEFSANVTSTLAWDRIEQDRCVGAFTVTVENKGKTAFDVNAIELRVHSVPFELSEKDSLKFFDYKSAQKTPTVLDPQTFKDPNEPLIYHYTPGSAYSNEFAWAVRRVEGRVLLATAKVRLTDASKQQHSDETWAWDWYCKDRRSAVASEELKPSPARRSDTDPAKRP